MKKIDHNAIIEGVTELFRTGLIAVIPLIIDGLSTGVINWRVVGIAGAISVLRAVDKWLHAKGVETPLDLKGMDSLKK